MLTPYHAFVISQCAAGMSGQSLCQAIQTVEPTIRKFAADNQVTVIGSYDGTSFGMEGDDFWDASHMFPRDFEKLRVLTTN